MWGAGREGRGRFPSVRWSLEQGKLPRCISAGGGGGGGGAQCVLAFGAELAPCLNHWMGREGAYLAVCADFWNRTTPCMYRGGGGGGGLLGGVGWSKSSGVCWSLEQNKFPGYMGRKGEEGGGGGGGKSSGVRWLSGTAHIDSGRFHTGDILSGYFVLAC